MRGRIDRDATVAPANRKNGRIHLPPFSTDRWHHLVIWDSMRVRATMAFQIFAAHVARRDQGTIAADPFYGWRRLGLAGIPINTISRGSGRFQFEMHSRPAATAER
jgi:hypothetical protein